MRSFCPVLNITLVRMLLASVPALLWPAPDASAQTRSLAEIAAYQGPDRMERLVAGAQREGVVSFYTSLVAEDTTPVIEAFRRKYHIDVQVWRASTEAIVQRALAESRAGRCPADAFHSGPPALEPLHREKLLQAVQSPLVAEVMPQALPAHREYVGVYLNLFAASYNTDLVKPDEAPTSYQDLKDARWKGRLAVEADDVPWFATLVARLGEEQGLRLFKDIVQTNGMSARKGHTLLANMVAAGDVPLALTVFSYKSDQLERAGTPVRTAYLPPVVALATSISVARCAPHPNAAILLYDFMIADAQAILAKRDLIPTNPKIGPLPPGIATGDLAFMDPDQMLDSGDRWTELWNNIVVKPQ
jgi:iron(III) transport system substrate-binding protein